MFFSNLATACIDTIFAIKKAKMAKNVLDKNAPAADTTATTFAL